MAAPKCEFSSDYYCPLVPKKCDYYQLGVREETALEVLNAYKIMDRIQRSNPNPTGADLVLRQKVPILLQHAQTEWRQAALARAQIKGTCEMKRQGKLK